MRNTQRPHSALPRAPCLRPHSPFSWGHRFAGGKGVATAAGVMLALSWPVTLTLGVVWLVMAFGFKISSLAALTVALLAPIGAFYVFGNGLLAWAMVAIALLLFWRHRANIEKLFAGKESTIGR